MVGLQSKPFRAAINSEFKGSSSVRHHLKFVFDVDQLQEAKSGVLKLDEQDSEIVGHMIKFMYSGDYTASLPRLDAILEDETTEFAASEAP